MGWFFKSNNRKNSASLPLVASAPKSGATKVSADSYLSQHLTATNAYGGAQLKALIPDSISALLEASPPTNTDELRSLESNLRGNKAIPLLCYVPDELRTLSDNEIWWFLPGVVYAGQYFSWAAVGKNGIYAASPQDENKGMMICAWDMAGKSECAVPEPNCCHLHLVSAEGVLTLSEFTPNGKASSLPIVKAIHDIYAPAIEACRGTRIWIRGSGGERYVSVATKDDLARAAIWSAEVASSVFPPGLVSGPGLTPIPTVVPGGLGNYAQVLAYIMIMVAIVDGPTTDMEDFVIKLAMSVWGGEGASGRCDEDLAAAGNRFNELESSEARVALFIELAQWLKDTRTAIELTALLEIVDDLICADDEVTAISRSFASDLARHWEIESEFSPVGPVEEDDEDDDDDEDGEDDEDDSSPESERDDAPGNSDGSSPGIGDDSSSDYSVDPPYLNLVTDPRYKDDYYFVTPTLENRPIRGRSFPAVDRVEELMRKFTPDEVDSICRAIRTERALPRLDFVTDILGDVCALLPNPDWTGVATSDRGNNASALVEQISSGVGHITALTGARPLSMHGAPIWFMPWVLFDGGASTVLWLSMNGLFFNHRPKKPQFFVQYEVSDDIESLKCHPDSVCGDDQAGCATLSVSCADDDLDVDLTEFHGEDCGAQFRIVEACWDLMKEIIDLSRGDDEWSSGDIRNVEFDSWDEVVEWAQNVAPAASDESPETVSLTGTADADFLETVNAIHATGTPHKTTIREVFGWFGYKRRTENTVAEVAGSLQATNIECFPDLNASVMDSPIELRLNPETSPGQFVYILDNDEGAADGTADPWASIDDDSQIVVPRYISKRFFSLAESVLTTGRPKRTTVRELVEWFGAQRRGRAVTAKIKDALEHLHLSVFPDFDSVSIDSMIEISLDPEVKPGTFTAVREE